MKLTSRFFSTALFEKLLFIVLGLCAGLLTGAAVLEIWLRCTHRLDIQQYTITNYLGANAAIRFRPAADVQLGWEHSNCTATDPFGNNDAAYPIEKEHNVYRILAIGDSITENGAYSRHLAELLNRASHNGQRYEVWNCGVGGYNLVQYYYNLKYKGFKLDPDLILLGFCLNDIVDSNLFVSRGADGRLRFFDVPLFHNAPITINRTLFFHSYAYRFATLALLLKMRAPRAAKNGSESLLALKNIIDEADRRNIPLLAVIIPYLKSTYTPSQAAEYAMLKTSLAGTKICFIDLHGAFTDIDNPGWRDKPDDFIHPSMNGHQLIANRIFDYLSSHPAFLRNKSNR